MRPKIYFGGEVTVTLNFDLYQNLFISFLSPSEHLYQIKKSLMALLKYLIYGNGKDRRMDRRTKMKERRRITK